VTALAWASLSTPAGRLSVACSSVGVARVDFGRPGESAPAEPAGPHERSRDRGGPGSPDHPGSPAVIAGGLSEARRQLAEYLSGQRKGFDLPLDWSAVSGLHRQVLGVLLASVGYGQTVTYGTLARRAGLRDDGPDLPARAVGQIMGSNPIPVIVPCHRVVASDGLGGYSGGAGLEVKRWLLILEGALPPTLDWEPACPGA
jgi:methylated-DNA-[protein]-cysteine S-methyltransferase